MYIEQLYTNCLAQAAYYIESNGEAAIVDPIREWEPYVELAARRGARIRYIFETHVHADFVSGHLDLARATGATIVFGPEATTAYDVHAARDGERFQLGDLAIETLHTPGHTPESTCYLLSDETGRPSAIFTGDTLFVGDVGRPDLLDGRVTKESLASRMYDSLRNKILPLADDIVLYPGHGPGSSCGKNIGKETWSTLGEQKRRNYALREMSREAFIHAVTEGLTAPPAYYFFDATINKKGYTPLEEVLARNVHALDLEAFEGARSKGALVLDVRGPEEFELGFIPGSINIGLDGQYALWVGTLIDSRSPLAIVAPPGREEEAIRRLARVGYEQVVGFLNGGFDTWQAGGRPVERISSVEPEAFHDSASTRTVLDVRKLGEFETAHVDGAQHIPLAELEARLGELDPREPYLIHCAGGYRSMIAASLLRKKGFEDVLNLHGGFSKIRPPVPEGSSVPL